MQSLRPQGKGLVVRYVIQGVANHVNIPSTGGDGQFAIGHEIQSPCLKNNPFRDWDGYDLVVITLLRSILPVDEPT